MTEFRDLLADSGLITNEVKLLRHYNSDGRATFDAWKDAPEVFWRWVSHQKIANAGWFRRPIWANFVALGDGDTLFVGLTEARIIGPTPPGTRDELRYRAMPDGKHHTYRLTHMNALRYDAGRLLVDWLPGRNWTRNAENHSYPVR